MLGQIFYQADVVAQQTKMGRQQEHLHLALSSMLELLTISISLTDTPKLIKDYA